MAVIIPLDGTNYTINAGAAIRFGWGWGDHPAGIGGVMFFAMPPSIRTSGNRLVSSNHAVHQEGNVVYYTVDISCENFTGTGIGAGYRVVGGGLV